KVRTCNVERMFWHILAPSFANLRAWLLGSVPGSRRPQKAICVSLTNAVRSFAGWYPLFRETPRARRVGHKGWEHPLWNRGSQKHIDRMLLHMLLSYFSACKCGRATRYDRDK